MSATPTEAMRYLPRSAGTWASSAASTDAGAAREECVVTQLARASKAKDRPALTAITAVLILIPGDRVGRACLDVVRTVWLAKPCGSAAPRPSHPECHRTPRVERGRRAVRTHAQNSAGVLVLRSPRQSSGLPVIPRIFIQVRVVSRTWSLACGRWSAP